jgi:hypothetical protein
MTTFASVSKAMRRLVIFLFLSVFLVNISCKQCKQCSYTYTETVIIQTPNGEEEVVNTKTGWVYDEDTLLFKEECIKQDESFTIEQAYEDFAATTTLDNFSYTCVDK